MYLCKIILILYHSIVKLAGFPKATLGTDYLRQLTGNYVKQLAMHWCIDAYGSKMHKLQRTIYRIYLKHTRNVCIDFYKKDIRNMNHSLCIAETFGRNFFLNLGHSTGFTVLVLISY